MNNIFYLYCSKNNIESRLSLHKEVDFVIGKLYPKTILTSVEFSEEFLIILIKDDVGSFSEEEISLILSTLKEINHFVLTHYRFESFPILEVNVTKDNKTYLLEEDTSEIEENEKERKSCI